MIKKIITSLVITGSFLTSTYTHAQMDARKVPYFLESTEPNAPKLIKKKDLFKPGVMTPEMLKPHPLPEKLLTDNGIKLINCSGNSGNQSETWIAINPANPNVIVSAANDTKYNQPGQGIDYKMSAYYTTDGGNTWKVSLTPSNIGKWIDYPSNGSMTNFDPGLAFDSKGWLYYCYGFAQTVGDAEADNGVFVCRSKDGGATWEDPIPVTYTATGSTTQPFNDRYMIAADFQENSPYKDRIYVAWQRFKQNPSIVFAYSEDNGDSFSNTISIPGGADGATQSPMPAPGPNGEVYLVWQSSNSYSNTTDALFQKSMDGGKSWMSNPTLAQTVTTVGTYNSSSGRHVLADKQNIRMSSYPEIAVDLSTSAYRGTIYVVQSGLYKNQNGVYMAKSTDGGSTWAKNIRVDDNDKNNDLFMPSVTVDPKTGLVAVLYYSSQNDATNKGADAYVAVSNDGGATFSRTRITPTTWYLDHTYDVSPQGAGNFYWGDYTAIAAWNGRIYPSFWMPASPQGSFYNVNVYTALLSISPEIPKNLTAENSYKEPNKVILRWNDPEKDLLGGVLSSFKIYVYRDDNKIGEVDKGVQTYTDETAENGKTYKYSIKAVMASNFESEMANIMVTPGGALKPLPPTEVFARPKSGGFVLYWKNPVAHVDSSYLQDLKKIDIYNGSTLIKSVDATNSQSGQMSSETISLPEKAFYNIRLKAVTERNSTQTESDFTALTFAYSGEPITVFSDNFDSPSSGLPRLTSATGGWGVTTKKVKSAPNAFTDSPSGNYGVGTNSVIFAPTVINQKDTTLSFDEIALIDKMDGGYISISKDFGRSWEDLLWLTKERSKTFTDDVNTSDWYTEHLNIKKYQGDTIYIRFSVYAPTSLKNLDGWYLDNLSIDDIPASVEEESAYPAEYISVSASPNPSAGNINLKLGLVHSGKALIAVYDALGNSVMNIANDRLEANEYSYNLDFSGMANGVYYCRVSIDGTSKTMPVIINR